MIVADNTPYTTQLQAGLGLVNETKGLLTNKLSKLSRTNVIVPVAVEGVAFDVDCR